MNPVFEISNLNIALKEGKSLIKAVDDVSFSVERGSVLGIIGESGSGKSLTCMAALGLLPRNRWEYEAEVRLNGQPVPVQDTNAMRSFRGEHIAVIMQNPMGAFNPTMTIKRHFEETLTSHSDWSKARIKSAALKMLSQMRISDPASVYNSYPFECSGGMLQRVMIALAIIMEPEVLIADEPTTALDITVQREIIRLINEMRKKHNMAVVIVSHDLNIVSNITDEIAVMYSGYIVEKASSGEILQSPAHPYSAGLFHSRPGFSKQRLLEMPGQPLPLPERQRFAGCLFADRCPNRQSACIHFNMDARDAGGGHLVRCCVQEAN